MCVCVCWILASCLNDQVLPWAFFFEDRGNADAKSDMYN